MINLADTKALKLLCLSWVLLINPQPSLADNSLLLHQHSSAQHSSNVSSEAADRLLDAAIQQYEQRQYLEAIALYEKTFKIQEQLSDQTHAGQTRLGRTLYGMGLSYFGLARYAEALTFLNQARSIFQTLQRLDREAQALIFIGSSYNRLSRYSEALTAYELALVLFRRTQDKLGEGDALNNIGLIYDSLGRYSEALTSYQKALKLSDRRSNPRSVAATLQSIGNLYRNLGQYSEALAYLQQALDLFKTSETITGQGRVLLSIGLVYSFGQQYSRALTSLQEALSVSKTARDREAEAHILSNLGYVYGHLRQYAQAQLSLNQALQMSQTLGNRKLEARTLDSLGSIYQAQGRMTDAIKAYEYALLISRDINDQEAMAAIFANLASLYLPKQPNIAIAFYKQSVKVTESIRENIRPLSRDLQESYTGTIAGTYRKLADLLLSQGRILEAQQVLERLKVQELRDYTRDVRSGSETNGIELNRIEQEILREHNSLVTFAQRVYECERDRCANWSKLNQQREALVANYNAKMNSIVATIRQRRATDDAFFNPIGLSASAREIVEAQPGTLLIYPLVLENKLWLLWVASGGVVKRIEVPVTQR